MLAQSKGERETEQKETGGETEDRERGGGTKTDNRKNKRVRDKVRFNEGGIKQYCTEMEFEDINLIKYSSLLLHTTVPSAGGIEKLTYSTLWF